VPGVSNQGSRRSSSTHDTSQTRECAVDRLPPPLAARGEVVRRAPYLRGRPRRRRLPRRPSAARRARRRARHARVRGRAPRGRARPRVRRARAHGVVRAAPDPALAGVEPWTHRGRPVHRRHAAHGRERRAAHADVPAAAHEPAPAVARPRPGCGGRRRLPRRARTQRDGRPQPTRDADRATARSEADARLRGSGRAPRALRDAALRRRRARAARPVGGHRPRDRMGRHLGDRPAPGR
jgi:hypothetical protein